MEEISNESSNKIINNSTILKTIKKSQTFIGNPTNLFKILNDEKKRKKINKRKEYYNFKIKLNIFENFKEKQYTEEINTSIPCEVKKDDMYEQGYLQTKNSSLIILRTPIEDVHNNFSSDIGLEKIIDLKKYNNSSLNTDTSTNISMTFNKNKNAKNNNFILYLDFNLITCKLVIHKKKQKFRLIILGLISENKTKGEIYQYRIIKFKMTNAEKGIFNNICRNINNNILSSKGYKENMFNTSLNNYFGKDYFISHIAFNKVAKTGDLILFRSFSFCSQCQRCITKGQYDHIGLLIKYYNELYVYETTGRDGVLVRKWYEFIHYYWYLLCEKMTFRKLIVTQDAMKKFITNNNYESLPNLGKKTSNFTSGFSDSNLDYLSKAEIERQFYYLLTMKIDNFVQNNKGKKYYFSLWKYFFKSFYKSKKTDNFKNEGYFCSELIAAVYNYCEIISNKINITNYLPSSFAENGDASFNEGFGLGPEYIIIFS